MQQKRSKIIPMQESIEEIRKSFNCNEDDRKELYGPVIRRRAGQIHYELKISQDKMIDIAVTMIGKQLRCYIGL